MRIALLAICFLALSIASPALSEPWNPPCTAPKTIEVQIGGTNHDLIYAQWRYFDSNNYGSMVDHIRDGALDCTLEFDLENSAIVISGTHHDIANFYGISGHTPVIIYIPWRDGPLLISNIQHISTADGDVWDTFMTTHGTNHDRKQRFCWRPKTSKWYWSNQTTDGTEPFACTSEVDANFKINPR